MWSIEAVLATSAGILLALSVVVLFSTGSIMAVVALWTLTILILFVLWHYGFINFDTSVDQTAGAKPKPANAATNLTAAMTGNEVFHIDDDAFTYDESAAVCAAYDSELATLEQVIDAYNGGAEWCGYGWSVGGMALYPTQKATWDALQREVDPAKRTACGRPGVNGGYFDPASKFGVNCFGFKPLGKVNLPRPPPGTDMTAFKRMVDKFKAMLKNYEMAPFSRQQWSGYDGSVARQATTYGSQFQTKESFTNSGDPTYSEDVSGANQKNSAYGAGPYGLRGSDGKDGGPGPAGPTGPAGQNGLPGPKGDNGIPGASGADGTPGQTGPTGPRGTAGATGATGATGPQGVKGDSTGVVGPTGPTGQRGTDGRNGSSGAPGATGPAGPQGIPGATGPAGVMSRTPTFDRITIGDFFLKPGPDGVDLKLGRAGLTSTVSLGVTPANRAYVYADALGRPGGWL